MSLAVWIALGAAAMGLAVTFFSLWAANTARKKAETKAPPEA